MSVVNQMLKDLDKRQQPHNLAHVPAGQASQAATNPWWLLLGGTLLGIILLALGLWLGGYLGSGSQSASQTQNQAANQSGSRAEPSQTVPYEPGPTGRNRPQPKAVSSTADGSDRLSLEPEAQNSALQLPSKSLAPSEQSKAPDTGLNAQGSAFETKSSETNDFETKSPEMYGSETGNLKSSRADDSLETSAVAERLAAKEEPLGLEAGQEPAQSVQIERPGRDEKSGLDQKPSPNESGWITQSTSGAAKPSQAKMSVTQVSLTPAELSQKKLQQGQQAKELGQLDKAMSAYAEALRLNDANHNARQELAALFYGRGELDKAAVLLRQGAESYPQQPTFWLLLARVQKARSELPLALASLQQIADGSELGREKWLLQAEIGQSLKDWPLVQQSYLSLIRQDASQGRWWLGLAYAQDASGDYDAAKASYQEALKRQGLSSDARDYIENRLAQIGGRQ
ncbi:tetratricopeptide repeat protein [Shewanella algae]|uniref:tetratricopeptide repeat protein n=1 Tax=Shewanella algae TaxID=38313 RepID=UPI001AADA220|nr:tetratricopeptide repeat protein [Shewanella algae]MBO2597891.1 tetratricopeptide repeat protein [Shewanella algae]MBO2698025.1 tetratricopeptide repeat protein [Shewanella algae]